MLSIFKKKRAQAEVAPTPDAPTTIQAQGKPKTKRLNPVLILGSLALVVGGVLFGFMSVKTPNQKSDVVTSEQKLDKAAEKVKERNEGELKSQATALVQREADAEKQAQPTPGNATLWLDKPKTQPAPRTTLVDRSTPPVSAPSTSPAATVPPGTIDLRIEADRIASGTAPNAANAPVLPGREQGPGANDPRAAQTAQAGAAPRAGATADGKVVRTYAEVRKGDFRKDPQYVEAYHAALQASLQNGVHVQDKGRATQQQMVGARAQSTAMQRPMASGAQMAQSPAGAGGGRPNLGLSAPGMAAEQAEDPNKQGDKLQFIKDAQQSGKQYLITSVQKPVSPFILKAGQFIPVTLKNELNTDVPGPVYGIVRSDVYDTPLGKYKLIPAGSTLVGAYQSIVAYGQERVVLVWNRLDYPDGSYLDLMGQPGLDFLGAAGVSDEVKRHWGSVFTSAIMVSMVGGTAAVMSSKLGGKESAIGAALGAQFAQTFGGTALEIVRKGLNVQPTLIIRGGTRMNVGVQSDILFLHGPWRE